ncbi:MAG: nucleoside/nucleotide kinase family protein [Pseudorhodobacter sp.]
MKTETTLTALTERLATMARAPSRSLIALAGPPGAGKSHIAEALMTALDKQVPGQAAILPLDGYHFDDTLLDARGHRLRKGAPFTFDVDGFAVMLDRLGADDGRDIVVPVFDRSIEIARAGARVIPPSVRLIIVEGNYLLLDDPAWTILDRHFALTIFIDVPETVLRQRLTSRWTDLDPAEAERKLEANDFPNMRLVLAQSRAADLYLPNGGGA